MIYGLYLVIAFWALVAGLTHLWWASCGPIAIGIAMMVSIAVFVSLGLIALAVYSMVRHYVKRRTARRLGQ